MNSPHTLASGFAFPEGPRWHEGQLWFSDQHDGQIIVLDPDGTVAARIAVPGGPSGMGWMPDGSLLVTSMHERRLYRRAADGQLVAHAELAAFHPGHSNDMVVDATGRAYAGNIGYDFNGGEDPRATCLVAVAPDGTVSVAADALDCPNGTVITPDGKTLIIAESMANRLTAFTVADDGTLLDRRIFAQLGDHIPDGICLDAEGAIWAASPYSGQVIRVRDGGEIVDSVTIDGAKPYACMLGGNDGRDLFVCCAGDHDPAVTMRQRAGRIDVARVTIPGAGRP